MYKRCWKQFVVLCRFLLMKQIRGLQKAKAQYIHKQKVMFIILFCLRIALDALVGVSPWPKSTNQCSDPKKRRCGTPILGVFWLSPKLALYILHAALSGGNHAHMYTYILCMWSHWQQKKPKTPPYQKKKCSLKPFSTLPWHARVSVQRKWPEVQNMKQVVKSPYTMMHCDGLLGDWTGGDLGGRLGAVWWLFAWMSQEVRISGL